MNAGVAAHRHSAPATRVRVVTPDDYRPLAKMLAAFPWEGLAPMPWPERFAHWWEKNPAFEPSWQRGWVIEAAEGLVGFLGSVPRRIAIDGQLAISANTTTWWVAPEHRKHSLSLLAHFNRQKAACHFNTTGSSTALELMAAFGYKLIQEHQPESLLVVDPARIAAQKIRQRIAGWRLPGTELATRAVDALAPVGSLVQRLRLPLASDRYYCGEVSRIDEGFDALSGVMQKRYSLTADRGRASLEWYMGGSVPERKVLIACWRGSELAGYALGLQRDSGSLAGLPVLDCLDLARDQDDPQLLSALMNGLAETARQRQVPLVVVRHYDSFIGRCCRDLGLPTRLGPPRRESARLPPSVAASQAFLTQFHGDFFV